MTLPDIQAILPAKGRAGAKVKCQEISIIFPDSPSALAFETRLGQLQLVARSELQQFQQSLGSMLSAPSLRRDSGSRTPSVLGDPTTPLQVPEVPRAENLDFDFNLSLGQLDEEDEDKWLAEEET